MLYPETRTAKCLKDCRESNFRVLQPNKRMWASLVLFFLFLSLSLGASADERLIRTSLEILDGESIELAEIDGKNIQIDGRLNETVIMIPYMPCHDS